MATYRQIRPSWKDVRQPTETIIEMTAPAPAPAPAQLPQPAPAPTGTSAIYQQVIASLQNQVNTLLSMYMEAPGSSCVPEPAPAPAHAGYPSHVYYS